LLWRSLEDSSSQVSASFFLTSTSISTTLVALERDFGNTSWVLGNQRGQRCKNWSYQLLLLMQKDPKVLVLTEKLNSLLKLGDALPASATASEQKDL